MVRSAFSEFHYAYNMTREFEEGVWPFDSIGHPVFPTQAQEAEVPADVLLNSEIGPVFVQYKRSEQMVRSNAGEWDAFGRSYFRFKIYQAHRSNQHNHLVELARRFPFTFYAAPGFIRMEELLQLAATGSVNDRSMFVPCLGLDEIQGRDRHRIAFTLQPRKWAMFSQPENIDGFVGFDELFGHISRSDDGFFSFEEVRDKLLIHRETTVEQFGLWPYPPESPASDPLDWIQQQQKLYLEAFGVMLHFLYRPAE